MKPFGVRVAIVQPGIIDTPMAHSIHNPPPSQYSQGQRMAALFDAALRSIPPLHRWSPASFEASSKAARGR